MNHPCFNKETHTDCPKRHSGCAVDCPNWEKYCAERDKEYEKRYEDGELRHAAVKTLMDRKNKKLKRAIANRASGFRKNV